MKTKNIFVDSKPSAKPTKNEKTNQSAQSNLIDED
jgi:hypothetical protein